ncbi:hypothetical protein D7W79_00325 [Corallococcus exercitus]|uniref:Uncharacterized protein n=1 Tax=Corallococcus exercitus TaxID=2316736 RepID=A0A3A8IIW6_9BACT|nr:hypothetical protein [Corallococcus exercitus]NOK31814.1 hypothetical protein [Corallococcus exercitus]RKG83399.1 hypothetical protein D7W79_00325 [Corallococcus exercitus]
MEDRRIPSLSIAPSIERQTPKTEFGPTLARAAREVVRTGAGLVGGMLPSGAISSAVVSTLAGTVSAAVPAEAVSSVSATGGASAMSARASTAGATAGTGAAATGQGDAWDLLEAQKLMAADGQKFNMAYLSLQNEMQKESREHNAISNIMKVRHDSAKAAINNIR